MLIFSRVCKRRKERAARHRNRRFHTIWPYGCIIFLLAGVFFPNNLPPGVAMRPEYIFLSLVIPGPEHPGKKFSVLMQPLIDELQTLKDGVLTWDASIKKSFTMKAAYQMSIHDFPALWMFVGWSTHGLLACHRCLGDTKSLHSLRVIRRVGLIVIDVFFPWTMNLEPKVMHLERIQ